MSFGKTFLAWVTAFVLVGIFFYAMDLWIMGVQGLPLNWDMTPAQ